jgi:ribosome-binding factor A
MTRQGGYRPRRVAETIRTVVTAFLHEEARDPRIGFVTVTGVRLSGDLRHAAISFVAHGGSAVNAETLEALNHAVPAVRRAIGRAVRLKVVPEVVFEVDKGIEHAARIDELIAGLHRDPPSGGGYGGGSGGAEP